MAATSQSYLGYIGVDGGATRTRARLRAPDGLALAEAESGAANIYVDFAAGVAAMRAAVAEAITKAGFTDADRARLALGIGLAGLATDEDARKVGAAFPEFALVRAVHDATAACLGAHEGRDGGLVVAGTGSAAMARVAGRETTVGARGFLVGDDGSGARIGADAVRAAMRACDGIGPTSGLTDAILAHFHRDPVAVIRWAVGAKPADYGAFAPLVFEHAARRDPIALEIVHSAARAVGALTRRLLELGAPKVALVGGVGEALRPYYERDVDAALRPPLHDPTDGGILLAGGRVSAPE